MDTRYGPLRLALRAACESFSLSSPESAAFEDATGVGELAEPALCRLSQRLARNLSEVTENAAAARAALDDARDSEVLGDAIASRASDLAAELAVLEARKVAAIEAELVAVDVSLELLQGELAAVIAASERLSDAELLAQRGELEQRLVALRSALRTQPLEAVETTAITFTAADGCIVAERGLSAADHSVRVTQAHVKPGEVLRVCIECPLAPQMAQDGVAVPGSLLLVAQDGEVCKLSRLIRLTARVVVSPVAAERGGAAGVPLAAIIALASDGRSIIASLPVPEDVPAGSQVFVDAVCIAGRPAELVPGLPVAVPVIGGLAPPFEICGLHGFNTRPCSSSLTGALYLVDEGASVLRVFSSTGVPRAAVDVASLGLSTGATATAFDAASDTLLVGEKNGRRSKVVALCTRTMSVQWATGSFNDCVGVSVLPARGRCGVFVL